MTNKRSPKQGRKKKPPPPPTASIYPAAVVQLAHAFQAGEDYTAPLHDALVESGHPGPASHFSGPDACRPGKTCLVVEDILDPQKLDPDDPTAEWPSKEPEEYATVAACLLLPRVMMNCSASRLRCKLPTSFPGWWRHFPRWGR